MAAEPASESRPVYAGRVEAPSTRGRSNRLTPTFALGWLHLLPEHAFPIRSREDLADKLSEILVARPASEPDPKSHGLPASGRSEAGGESGGR